jgi:hypothetical protein
MTYFVTKASFGIISFMKNEENIEKKRKSKRNWNSCIKLKKGEEKGQSEETEGHSPRQHVLSSFGGIISDSHLSFPILE